MKTKSIPVEESFEQWKKDPGFAAEYDVLEAEFALASAMTNARGDADMTAATRLTTHGQGSFRPLHVAGNQMVCGIINWMFKSKVSDIFSGYRAFTRESARQIPITARGFDVETELTLQALYRGQVIK